jgi:hypothetical protein
MRIFLGAPLTEMLEPTRKRVRADFRMWLEHLICELETAGHEIVSAHTRELWGEGLQEPLTALRNDTKAMYDCDIYVAIIAYPGYPISPGVQMELGMAHLLDKAVFLVAPHKIKVPYLNRALLAKQSFDGLIHFELGESKALSSRLLEALCSYETLFDKV